ncbi:MAG: Sapep family Mn(2+)-dependent dipeptidase [Ruminococcus sp.]|nr:Sapep family Mn(2+)-dependent dipeptidase [Ruminococcus sp.]
MLEKEIEQYYTDHEQEMLDRLAELIAIDSSFSEPRPDEGMPFGEGSAKALGWVQSFGQEIGLITRSIDNYAVAMDWKDTEPALAILSHADVVPANAAEWTTPPFEMNVRDGCIFGRGSVDDKGPTVAVMYAAKCLKDLGVTLDRSFRMVVGGNEEQGCEDIKYYAEREPFPDMVITPDGSFPVLNCEKGMVHLTFSGGFDDSIISTISAGKAINAIPDSCTVTRCGGGHPEVYQGKAAHGSRPQDGDNAVTRFLSGYRGSSRKLLALKKLFPRGEFDGRSCGLGFSDEMTGSMTCALTVLNREEGGELHGGIDIRFPIDRSCSEIKDIICSALERAGFRIDSCEGMEPHFVSPDSRLVQTLLSVYEKVSGRKGECIAEGGITYVHNTPGGVAFGAEYPWEQNNMHGADEHIPLSTFRDNFLMYAHALIELLKD